MPDSPATDLLEVGETYFLTTRGHCDCGTALGSLLGHEPLETGYAEEVQRFEKRGWSQNKIQRWLSDKQKAAEQRREEARVSGGPGAEEWLAFLREVTASGAAESVAILLHFYSGGVESERVRFSREVVSLSDVSVDFLLTMEEDRLYVFSA